MVFLVHPWFLERDSRCCVVDVDVAVYVAVVVVVDVVVVAVVVVDVVVVVDADVSFSHSFRLGVKLLTWYFVFLRWFQRT